MHNGCEKVDNIKGSEERGNHLLLLKNEVLVAGEYATQVKNYTRIVLGPSQEQQSLTSPDRPDPSQYPSGHSFVGYGK